MKNLQRQNSNKNQKNQSFCENMCELDFINYNLNLNLNLNKTVNKGKAKKLKFNFSEL